MEKILKTITMISLIIMMNTITYTLLAGAPISIKGEYSKIKIELSEEMKLSPKYKNIK